ncbi:MAG: TonB-dependent receptor, partial [Chlorobiales bacterium]|nr:TonB-dependent receptor [Chlorobiales bacterium]
MAQNKSRIIGTITTSDGAVIPGVKVTISSDALISRSLMTVSNDRGTFRFVLLPIGTYTIKFEKDGYRTIEQSDVELGFDATVTLDKVMQTADFEDVIIISGEAPIVDKTSSTISDKLDLEFLQNQAKTADIWALPNLSAGFTDDSGFGGVQEAGNAYNFDGVNVSDPATGTPNFTQNLEAVEQIDIQLFGAPAEYGAFTGASLNVVTKSGGNDFSGEANYFFQSKEWVGDNTTEYERVSVPSAAKVQDPNFALGGPVVQDMVWFFGNYNWKKSETDRDLADGPFIDDATQKRGFLKLSSRWDDRNITYASIIYDRFNSPDKYFWPIDQWLVNTTESLWDSFWNSDTYMVQHSYVLNDSIILEGRFARFISENGSEPVNDPSGETPMMFDYLNRVHMPGSSANRMTVSDRNRDNLLLTTNYYNDQLSGSHSFKFGFEYESSLNSRFMKITDLQVWYGDLTLERHQVPLTDAGTVIRRFAGFAQDSWSVNNKLTINYGFRYDST